MRFLTALTGALAEPGASKEGAGGAEEGGEPPSRKSRAESERDLRPRIAVGDGRAGGDSGERLQKEKSGDQEVDAYSPGKETWGGVHCLVT